MEHSASGALRGFGLTALAALVTGCAHLNEPDQIGGYEDSLCADDRFAILTDFDGAGQHGCALTEDGAVLTVWPEPAIAAPINPSPWYAFDVKTRNDTLIALRLDYGAYRHRYAPWVSVDEGEWTPLPDTSVHLEDEGRLARFELPVARARIRVAAQPITSPEDVNSWAEDVAAELALEVVRYGTSLEGRDLTALVAGPEDAVQLIVALARQHPPERAGALAFEVFVQDFMVRASSDTLRDLRVLFLPLINPDGLARGHWRNNAGGVDLNRDWFDVSQPETRAAARLIKAEAEGRESVAFLDFHSTHRTLIYSPDLPSVDVDVSLPRALKEAFDAALEPDPEWITGHNDGKGTAKNWALSELGVAGLTVELADTAGPEETQTLGRVASSVLRNHLEINE